MSSYMYGEEVALKLEELVVPPCRTCAAERSDTFPATHISNAHHNRANGDVSPFPLCSGHADVALVAWGNVYPVDSEEGRTLLKALPENQK